MFVSLCCLCVLIAIAMFIVRKNAEQDWTVCSNSIGYAAAGSRVNLPPIAERPDFTEVKRFVLRDVSSRKRVLQQSAGLVGNVCVIAGLEGLRLVRCLSGNLFGW